jgi:putative ABC transport system permease protein
MFRARRAEEDLVREMASHLAMLEEEHRRRGLTPDEARLAARRSMGSVALAQDRHRDARSFGWIDDARQDLRCAFRTLGRNPGFTAVAILTMALSIGATATLFSVVYGVLMRPLPWPEAGRLVRLQETRGGRVSRIPWTITNAAYLAWRDKPTTIEDIGGWFRSRPMTMSSDRESERLTIGGVTPSLFSVLRARPEIGRVFVDGDSERTRVVILGYALWQRRFGARTDIIGTSVRLDNQPYTIVGVMPRSFSFPTPETEAWTPFVVAPVQAPGNTIRLMMFSAMARLRAGATPEQAAAEATSRARGAPDLKQTAIALFGSNGVPGLIAAPALDVMTAEVRPALMILLAAVGLLFVASTASLVVLQLARVATRRREIAVRSAIGAGTARLVRQWLVESAMLGLLGAAAGLFAAMLVHRSLPAVLPAGFPRVEDVRLDWRVAVFACVVACLASFACGMVPAFGRRRARLVDALTDGPAITPPVRRTPAARVRILFMGAQVAVACILLVGASLLVRSFSALLAVDRGFDPHGLLTMRIPLPPRSTFVTHKAFLDRVQERFRALPGVTDVAFGNALPFVTPGLYSGLDLYLPRDPSTKVEVQTIMRAVSPEYFRAMGLRITQGRPMSASDIESSPPVMVVNRTFASRYLEGNAIGQHLTIRSDRPSFEVIGVVDDMRQGSNTGGTGVNLGGVLDPPLAEMFLSHRQWPYDVQDIIAVIRSAADPAALTADVRAIVRAEDPSLPVDSLMTMDDRVAESLAGPRTYAVFLAGFALCALAIAGVGLYGVLSYTTAQRTREIGLRTALGAQTGDVMTLVGKQAIGITIGGLATGLIASFFLSTTMSSLIYGVSARDAISFVTVPAVLLIVSTLACAVPVWRATRIDPIDALRST